MALISQVSWPLAHDNIAIKESPKEHITKLTLECKDLPRCIIYRCYGRLNKKVPWNIGETITTGISMVLYTLYVCVNFVTQGTFGVQIRPVSMQLRFERFVVPCYRVHTALLLKDIYSQTCFYSDHLSTKTTFFVSPENGFWLKHVLKEPVYKDHFLCFP